MLRSGFSLLARTRLRILHGALTLPEIDSNTRFPPVSFCQRLREEGILGPPSETPLLPLTPKE